MLPSAQRQWSARHSGSLAIASCDDFKTTQSSDECPITRRSEPRTRRGPSPFRDQSPNDQAVPPHVPKCNGFLNSTRRRSDNDRSPAGERWHEVHIPHRSVRATVCRRGANRWRHLPLIQSRAVIIIIRNDTWYRRSGDSTVCALIRVC